jgi:hypothetical protein
VSERAAFSIRTGWWVAPAIRIVTYSVNSYAIPALSLRWLYVDFNSYFASVEQQLRPELRGKPVAVVAVETDSTSAIAASYEAKAFGVKTGTAIHEARRLCPGRICVLARHERYVEFHHRLIEEIDRHVPVTADESWQRRLDLPSGTREWRSEFYRVDANQTDLFGGGATSRSQSFLGSVFQ